MESHYHAWVRAGRVFTMRPKTYNTQPAAFKAASKLRADPADRMVRQCEVCPKSAPSRTPKPSAIAAAVALELGMEATLVHVVLAAARAAGARIKAASEAVHGIKGKGDGS